MSESSRIETLLGALVDGENVDVVPQSRIETYLLALLKGDTDVKEPQSRIEAYLYQLCKNGMSGGGIIPTGTLEITENGTHDVTNYASAEVNVASSGGGSGDLDALIDGSITEVTSNATSVFAQKFKSHTSLLSVNLPLVTEIGDSAFYGCSELTTINFPKATSIMRYGFRECKKLLSAIFPLVTSCGISTFQECYELKEAFFPKLETIIDAMFYSCSKLIDVDFSMATSIGKNAFYGCKKLKKVIFPKVINSDSSPFYKCEELELVDLPMVKTFGSATFNSCYRLKAIILRNTETICTTSSNPLQYCYHFTGDKIGTYNPNGDKDGYIYVPKALLSDDDETKDYRRATNWTTFASQFRAIEDFSVDGTITGELDETKI